MGCALAATGCVTPAKRAPVTTLFHRAVYDLGCATQQLQLYHIDGRTKAMAGCGRRLVYVEHCDPSLGRDGCSWVLDTPTFSQAQWPQQEQAWAEQQRRQRQAQGEAAPEWQWRPRRARRFEQELGQERVSVERPRDPLQVPPAPSGSRRVRTELFPRDKQPAGSNNAPSRPIQRDLFSPSPKKTTEEQRREDALGF